MAFKDKNERREIWTDENMLRHGINLLLRCVQGKQANMNIPRILCCGGDVRAGVAMGKPR